MNSIAIKGQKRESLGKKITKELRKKKMIPCVAYGGSDPVHFTTTHSEVKKLIFSPEFQLAKIKVDKSDFSAIVKDVQYHPVTEEIIHIDFLRLVDGQPIKVELPVAFEGTAPGVRAGGRLVQSLRKVKVKTLPNKLIDKVILNVDKLEMGQSVRVRDISPIDGIQILNSPNIPVGIIEIPRALKSATAAAAKEEV